MRTRTQPAKKQMSLSTGKSNALQIHNVRKAGAEEVPLPRSHRSKAYPPNRGKDRADLAAVLIALPRQEAQKLSLITVHWQCLSVVGGWRLEYDGLYFKLLRSSNCTLSCSPLSVPRTLIKLVSSAQLLETTC